MTQCSNRFNNFNWSISVMVNVADMAKVYLIKNNYDGLQFEDECSCTTDNIFGAGLWCGNGINCQYCIPFRIKPDIKKQGD